MLGFTSPALNSRAKSCSYCPVLLSVIEVLLHILLPKAGIVLGKAVPWSPSLMLNWVMCESHSCKDLYTLRGAPRPIL